MIRLLLATLAAFLGMLVMAPLVVLALPFWVFAATTRALVRRLEPHWLPAKTFTEFEPEVGWKSTANVDAYHCVDDVFHVTTDAEGWRGQATIEESDLVVFGDSFAWGYGIDDAHFFANLVPGRRVKAIGAMGYNLAQECLWLERLSPRLSGKLVVWFVYLANDLIDNLLPHKQGRRMPFLRQVDGTGDWEIVTSHVNPSKWLYTGTYGRIYYDTLVEYCTPRAQPRREYAACESVLRRGKKVCEAVGARLVVVSIPDKTQLSAAGRELLLTRGGDAQTFDADLPDQAIGAVCAGLAIPFVAAKQHFDAHHYKDVDVHWNEAGHRRMAELLSGLADRYGSKTAHLPG
jgi:hypothetical protein